MFRLHNRSGDPVLEAYIAGRWRVLPVDVRFLAQDRGLRPAQGETVAISEDLAREALRDGFDLLNYAEDRIRSERALLAQAWTLTLHRVDKITA